MNSSLKNQTQDLKSKHIERTYHLGWYTLLTESSFLQHNITEDLNLHQRYCENLRYQSALLTAEYSSDSMWLLVIPSKE